MEHVRAVEQALSQSRVPLTVSQLAQLTGLGEREVDGVLWDRPALFVWQPGHRWSMKSAKSRPSTSAEATVADSKPELMASKPAKELGAFTLSNGLTIRIQRRALDTDAFFTVKSSGNTIELILNSVHEVFSRLPTPFDDDQPDGSSPYRELIEVLLASWALYEDSSSGTNAKRTLEDARLFWGRRAIEMMRE
jgi:hypothetical protein